MTGTASRLRDRTWFWLAVSLVPLAAIVGIAWWNGRPIGYADGLARLDDDPCDDGNACAGGGLLLDGVSWTPNCEVGVDATLVTAQPVAQGPGGYGSRIEGVDPTVAIAVRDSPRCPGSNAPVLASRCLSVAEGGLAAALDPPTDC